MQSLNYGYMASVDEMVNMTYSKYKTLPIFSATLVKCVYVYRSSAPVKARGRCSSRSKQVQS